MGYVKASTNNPYGFRPYQAILRPGGLGAFFPNAEAIGPNAVMVDRDAANPHSAPVPRGYYPPDARLQYSVNRRQGLGAGAGTITNTVTPIPFATHRPQQNRAWTNQAYQSQGTAAGTPVPANWPTNRTYTDTNGNVWSYNSSTGVWNIQVQNTYASSVPAGWPTNQPYTDSSGNTWTWSGSGGWQITMYANSAASTVAAANAAGATTVTPAVAAPSWLTDPTQELISGVPNWALVGGGALAAWLLMGRKR